MIRFATGSAYSNRGADRLRSSVSAGRRPAREHKYGGGAHGKELTMFEIGARKRRLQGGLAVVALGALAIAMFMAWPSSPSQAADHLDGPGVGTDGRTDLADLYVFHPERRNSERQNRGMTVLAMTVNPAAGLISGTSLDPRARYEFAIDNDGDAVEDIVYRYRVIGKWVTLSEVKNGRSRLISLGKTDQVAKVLPFRDSRVRSFVGLRDDPFFLDLNAFNAGAAFCQGVGGTGSNFFNGLDVTAFVLSVPTRWLGADNVGVWARTMVRENGQWVQVDRTGRPAISTVFIPTNPFEPNEPNQKDAYNSANPVDDQANFRDEIVDSLALLHSLNDGAGDDPSDDAAKVNGLADILLPDILTVDLSEETGFLNGRNLADDVIDAELGLITEGAVTTDCVDNDSDFTKSFPYLAPPNGVPGSGGGDDGDDDDGDDEGEDEDDEDDEEDDD